MLIVGTSVTVTPSDFFVWFDAKLKEKGYRSEREFAGIAGISHSVISKARSKTQPLGYDVSAKIADALGESRETVWRLAGHAPKPADWSPELDEWVMLFNQLSDDDREEMLTLGRHKAKRGKSDQKARAR